MHIEPECLSCIFNQALRVTQALDLSPQKAKEVLDLSARMLPDFSLSKSPPQNAAPMYEAIADMLGTGDIYAQQKQDGISHAQSLVPYCRSLIAKSTKPFLTATKIAVAGNVIDLASEYRYDLEEEIGNILESDFAIDDSHDLYTHLEKSHMIVYLADNAGENVFDRLYIETIKSLFKDIQIYYFVRSRPIINDICFDDLKNDPIHKVATVVDSGVNTPGIVVDALSEEARRLFFEADCIISKGMGNYECLSDYKELSLYYLLKVKCNVVARSLHLQAGNIVCKNAQK